MGKPAMAGHDFNGVITMNVPDGSKFVVETYVTQNAPIGMIGYMNKGKYAFRISSVIITPANDNRHVGEVIEEYDNVKITKNKKNGTTYYLYITKDNCKVILNGNEINLMKKNG